MAGAATVPRTAPRTAGGRRRAATGRAAASRGAAATTSAQARAATARAAPSRRAPATRSTPARRSRTTPARRPAPRRAPARRSRQATPIPGRIVPLAVGRTAGAVGGLADSGLVKRLTRGRLWIAALAVMLVGIVALNVVSLSLNSNSSDASRAIEKLEREASSLRAELAQGLSTQRIQNVAAGLGMFYPEPGEVRYLRFSDGDAAEAARRLRSGELLSVPAATPTVIEPVESTAAPVAPTEAAVEAAPIAGDEAAPPETTETVPAPETAGTEPAPASADPTGGAAVEGGISSP